MDTHLYSGGDFARDVARDVPLLQNTKGCIAEQDGCPWFGDLPSFGEGGGRSLLCCLNSHMFQ